MDTIKNRRRFAQASMGVLADKSRARTFYRFLSPIYDAINPFIWTDEMRDAAVDWFPLETGDRVLDVGCGTGFATEALRSPTNEVHGLDQSRHQLARAARKLPADVALYRGDAERLPFRDDSFDAIWSSGSIEYWPDPAATLAELRRVGRPGAPVLVVGPHEPSTWPMRKLADSIMWFYDADRATAWFETAGLEAIEHRTDGPWYNGSMAIITRARVPSA